MSQLNPRTKPFNLSTPCCGLRLGHRISEPCIACSSPTITGEVYCLTCQRAAAQMTVHSQQPSHRRAA